MAEYLHPGVYVEEKASGVRPIEGVGTSTAGFVGACARGVPNRATFVTSFRAFVSKFGDVSRDGPYLPYAVEQFFANGGKRCYVVRALSDASSRLASVTLPAQETNTPARPALRVEAKGNGAWGNTLAVRVEEGGTNPGREFRLVVLMDGVPVEVFDDLSMDPGSPQFVETSINDASEYISVASLNPAMTSPTGAPAQATRVTTAAVAGPLALGAGDTLALELPDRRLDPALTIPLGPLNGRPVAELVTAINRAWGAFNVTALLTAAPDAPSGRLRIRHNAAGYDQYFSITVSGATATASLAGLAGFAQGVGAALGGTLKSAPNVSYDIAAGLPATRTLTIQAGATTLNNIVLAEGAGQPMAVVLGQIQAALATDPEGHRVRVSAEGLRIVIGTTNRGSADAALTLGGTAAAMFGFRQLDGTAAPGTGSVGFGRNERGQLISSPGPFVLSAGSQQEFLIEGQAAGAGVVVTYDLGAQITNLQNVSAAQVAAQINATTGGTEIQAVALGGRVVVRRTRRGPLHSIAVVPVEGMPNANLRLNFSGGAQAGTADGDAAAPALRPAPLEVAGVNTGHALTGGDDGAPVSAFDLIGVADRKTGLHAFDDVGDVNFIAIPGASDPAVVGPAAGYCDVRGDCFFIADAPGQVDRSTPVTQPVDVREYFANRVTPKNGAAALYYPWLEIADRAGVGKNPRRMVPPSGFVAGLYARTDNLRGVWKAPAGTEATLIGPVGLEYSVTDAEQDILNPIGVNCVRAFPASGIVVWGARTFASQSDPERRYVPVRRYTIYLKQSIYRGTQWAVFEPNDKPLWDQLKAAIDDFMMGEFRRGALAGTKPDEAFIVKCDAELNPPSEVNAGRVNMEILFAPLKPSEFVIIRLAQKSQRPGG